MMPSANIVFPVQNLLRTPIETGGLCWLLFFLHQDIDSWPEVDPVTGVITSNLVFKTGRNFFTAQFGEKDRIYKEDLKQSASGPYVETTVQGILFNDSGNAITGVNAMIYNRFGLLIKERTGIQRIIGNKDAGAKFEYDYTSGSISTTRQRQCKWIFESPNPAPIYQGGGIVINGTVIPVGTSGGSGSSTPTLALHASLYVSSGNTLEPGDLTYTHPDLAGKTIMVFANGIYISTLAIAGQRYCTKALNDTTITFNGGVGDMETIDIFIF
jgi:hypothetical protein